jgi:hypothetical protein
MKKLFVVVALLLLPTSAGWPQENGKTIQAIGTLQPEDVAEIGSQIAGQIIKVGTDTDGKRIDFNSRVEAGTSGLRSCSKERQSARKTLTTSSANARC